MAADAATTWAVLTDRERIAPCLPGAQSRQSELVHPGVTHGHRGSTPAAYRRRAMRVADVAPERGDPSRGAIRCQDEAGGVADAAWRTAARMPW